MGKGRVNAFSFSISIALERRIVSPIFAESFWKKRRDTQSLKISQKYLISIFLLLFQKFRYLCFEYQKKVLLGKLRKWDFFELSSNTVTERHTQYVTKLFSQYLLNNQLYMAEIHLGQSLLRFGYKVFENSYKMSHFTICMNMNPSGARYRFIKNKYLKKKLKFSCNFNFRSIWSKSSKGLN